MTVTKRMYQQWIHALAFFPLLLAGLSSISASGQAVSARLLGTVTDRSQSRIVDATVTASNKDSGASIHVKTNSSGEFTFAELPPGNYSLAAEAPGFAKLSIPNIVVEIGDAKTLNLVLLPEGVVQSVNVSAEGPTINTDTTEVGSVVENRQAVDLPLNGRDPMTLVYLQAGTNPLDNQLAPSAQEQIGVVDGLPPGTDEVRVEGILASNPGFDWSAAHPDFPVPQESVGEYQVGTAGGSSDIGTASGAEVRVLLKSGTNQFHGSLFEFNRNTAYDANDFFSNRSGLAKAILRRNQYGFALGGPIRKDRTFFFTTAEWQKQASDSIEDRTVYTNALRSGIFRYYTLGANSSSLVNANGDPIVPASDIGTINETTVDPTRQGFDTVFLPVILAVMPAPNNYSLGDGFNLAGYRYQSLNPDNYYEVLAKIDQTLTFRNNLSLSLAQSSENAPQAKLYDGLSNNGYIELRRGLSLRLVTTASDHFINEFAIGGDLRSVNRPDTIAADQTPSGVFQLNGLGTTALSTGSTNGNIWNQSIGQVNPSVTLGFDDVMTLIIGNHSIEAGGEFWHETLNAYYPTDPYPLVTTVDSGNPATIPAISDLAAADKANAEQLVNDLTGTVGSITQDFFLDQPGGYTHYAQEYSEYLKHDIAFYVSDSWRVKKNVTVNAGLRWNIFPPVTIKNVDVYPVGGLNGALGVQGPTGQPTAWAIDPTHGSNVFATDYKSVLPSVGAIWDVFGDGKMAVRTSFHMSSIRAMIVNGDFSRVNYGETDSLVSNPKIQFSRLSTVLPVAVPATPFAPLGNVRLNTAYVAKPDLSNPYVEEWTFGLDREIFRGWRLSGTYIGNHAVGLWSPNDLNQVQLRSNGFLSAFLIAQQNLAANGSPTKGQSLGNLQALFAEVPAGEYTVITQGQAASLANYLDTTTSGGSRGGLVAAAGLPATFFRYNPQVLDLYVVGNYGQSTWNGMKAELQHRFNRGLSLQANYTLSKGFVRIGQLDQQTFTTPFRDTDNFSLNRSLSPLDSTHVVLANALYELPFGGGKRFVNSSHGLVNSLVSGWQLNGIFSRTTGRPLALTTGYDQLNQNVASTPNFTHAFSNLSKVNKSGSEVTFISASQKTAFSNPPAGSAGGLPLYALHGPGYTDLDTSLFKSVKLENRLDNAELQLRVEYFNVLNHANFASPTGNSVNINSGTFGVVTSDYAPRIGQLAAKIIF